MKVKSHVALMQQSVLFVATNVIRSYGASNSVGKTMCDMCVYMSNTTIFIGSILSIYYIRHNYMFRPSSGCTRTLIK